MAYLRSLTAPSGEVRYSRTSRQTPVWVTAQALTALYRRPFPIAPR
jgi:energy-coupling factor transport system substrate-specific component